MSKLEEVKKESKEKVITIPRCLYESMCRDTELVRHLSYYFSKEWVDLVRMEIEYDRKFGLGVFSDRKYNLNFPETRKGIKFSSSKRDG